MNNKFIGVALIAILVIAIGAYLFPKVQEPLGVASGPETFEYTSLTNGFQACGPDNVRATSTVNSAETLLASDLEKSCMIDYTLNVQAATLTLPASSTMSHILSRNGSMRTWYIRNATTTATNLTIAGGTGTLLKQATSTNQAGSKIIFGDTDGANIGRVTLIRKSNTDFEALFEPFRD